jgi:hypothetical protein
VRSGGTSGLTPGTFAVSINATGDITGYFSNSLGTHGFVRDSTGAVTKFEVNSATMPLSINDTGEITGHWQNNNGLNEAFVRAADGTLTTFCGNDIDVSCMSYAINDAGVATGFSGASGRGFIRNADGTHSSFDVKGHGPTPVSINQAGSITGYYSANTKTAFAWHGFVLTP